MRPAWIIFAAALAVAACQPQKPAAPVKTDPTAAAPVAPPPPAATPAVAPGADCPCAEEAKPKLQKASTRTRKARRAQRAAQPRVGEREYAKPPADSTGPGYFERTPQRAPERIVEDPDFAPPFASRDRYGYLTWPGKTPARP